MSYKCRICGSNDVDNQGDICELCAIGQDPYATGISTNPSPKKHAALNNDTQKTDTTQYSPKRSSNRKVLLNGGSDILNTDPYGNDISDNSAVSTVQIYAAGQVPQQNTPTTNSANIKSVPKKSVNQPVSSGIVKNMAIDNQKRSFVVKWVKSMFTGVPYVFGDEINMFQIFPDYSGTSLNALGNACDQVVVYGKLNRGAISENNDIEVFGRRDSNNNIIAKKIRNKATGTIVTPSQTMSCFMVWLITLVFIPLIISLFSLLIPAAMIIVYVIVIFFILKILWSLFRRRSK